MVDGSAVCAGANASHLVHVAVQSEVAGRVSEAARSAGDGVVLDNREHARDPSASPAVNAHGQGVAVGCGEGRGPYPCIIRTSITAVTCSVKLPR